MFASALLIAGALLIGHGIAVENAITFALGIALAGLGFAVVVGWPNNEEI